MTTPFETLIQAAIWAPSGDNTQPFQFRVKEEAGELEISVVVDRDSSPMNAGERMSRIAVGAAAENVVEAAKDNGWVVGISTKSGKEPAVVLQCSQFMGQSGKVPYRIRQRVTNRRLYDGQILAENEIASVTQGMEPSEGVRAIWVTDRGKLPLLAAEIGEADAQMFGICEVRKAFLKNVCLNRPPTEEVAAGLSLGSLEANWFERIGLRVLGGMPDPLFRWMGMVRTFRKKAVQLAESASGLCILVATGHDAKADFEVGRLMERAWLKLTAQGFAVQPMMSLPVLDNMATHWPLEKLPPSFQERTRFLTDGFQRALRTESNERIAAIMRFGRASPPTSRTGRLPPVVEVSQE
jgi:hypothetical protein